MKKFFPTLITIIAGIFLVAFAIHAQTAGNGSLTLTEDLQSDLFTLTVSDPDGVASFALEFKSKLPYSGDLSGCARSKTINNIAALNDNDLAETIKGRVTDCRGGETEFEISAVDAKGRAQVKKLGAEPVAPAPTPTAPVKSAEPQETKKAEEPKTAPEINYPIPELGNCKNEEACHDYCEISGNSRQCLDFAKKHQLLSEEEIQLAEKVLGVKGGPGGCNSRQSCENFCNDVDHIEECLAFAEENGLMKGRELEEAKKVRAAVQRGQKMPGGCKNKNACENYCKSSEHIDECLAFAEEAGFLSPKELEQARKFMPLMKSGKTPGACKTKDECEAYCDADEHMDECIDFAVQNDMIPKEEKEHIEAFKKAGGKGPGGCKGRQCQAFCENPDNQQTCFEWAKNNGLLKEEDLQRMEEGKGQLKKVLGDAPPEVKDCIEHAIPGGISALESGQFFGGEAVGEKIKSCFDGFMSQMGGSFGGPGEQGGPGGGNFSGPGGCKGPEECMSYCKENPEECQNFAPPGGGMPGGGEHGGFPGGGFPGGSTDGFSACGITNGASATFVCGINGKGAPAGKETTYFNECHAKQHGAEILHNGFCKGHTPCSDVAEPVCGTNGVSYTHTCIAKEDGAEVKHEGVCTGEHGRFPGGIPSGEKYVGPGGCATPDECIRYCKMEEHKKECDEFKTKEQPPGPSQGRGPGGCSTVEECRDYCRSNPQAGAECDAFTSEGGDEVKCQPDWEIKKDNRGYRYCSPKSCPEGTTFVVTDKFGRQACSPVGAQKFPQEPGGFPTGGQQPPSTDFQKQYQQQYQQQYEQQYQQQYQQQSGGFTPPPSGSYTQPPPPPTSSVPTPLGSVLAPFLDLIR